MKGKILSQYIYQDGEDFYEIEIEKTNIYGYLIKPLKERQEFIDLFNKLLLKEEKIEFLTKRTLKKPIFIEINHFFINSSIEKINNSKKIFIKNIKISEKVEFNLLVEKIEEDSCKKGFIIFSNFQNIPVKLVTQKYEISNKIKKGDYIKGNGSFITANIKDFNK